MIIFIQNGQMPGNVIPRLDKQKSGFLNLIIRKVINFSVWAEKSLVCRLVQFLTGHNKLKRHKNLQNGVNDPHSCRLCLEDEESSFHVIAECPATQSIRTRVFELPIPTILPNPPDWTVSQIVRFLKESTVGHMLDQD